MRSQAVFQGLAVGICRDEFNAGELRLNHGVDSIAARTTNTHNFDFGSQVHWRLIVTKHVSSPPTVEKILYWCATARPRLTRSFLQVPVPNNSYFSLALPSRCPSYVL